MRAARNARRGARRHRAVREPSRPRASCSPRACWAPWCLCGACTGSPTRRDSIDRDPAVHVRRPLPPAYPRESFGLDKIQLRAFLATGEAMVAVSTLWRTCSAVWRRVRPKPLRCRSATIPRPCRATACSSSWQGREGSPDAASPARHQGASAAVADRSAGPILFAETAQITTGEPSTRPWPGSVAKPGSSIVCR